MFSQVNGLLGALFLSLGQNDPEQPGAYLHGR